MELFIVNEWEEIEQAIKDGNLDIINTITKAVKKGVKRKFKKVTMFAVSMHDDPDYEYDWILENDQYKSMLETCLAVYIANEMYEECAELQKLVDSL